ncbi:MAG: prepilin-type N-terminal cleavage/methylation domain-containing protein [Bdellovibrionales bacterium]
MNNTQEKGFSLVELSIVLVIIGIIIGGVLTGQQVMESARITNVVSAIQAYQAQVQTYNQNFGTLPGDDANADSRFSVSVGVCSGTDCGDGKIGTSSSFNASSGATDASAESRYVWEQLRAANLVKNQGSDTGAQPSNPFGGVYGFQNGSSGGEFDSNIICISEIPGTAAQGIDARLDDGVRNDGQMRAIDGGSDGDKAYQEGTSYTICIRM